MSIRGNIVLFFQLIPFIGLTQLLQLPDTTLRKEGLNLIVAVDRASQRSRIDSVKTIDAKIALNNKFFQETKRLNLGKYLPNILVQNSKGQRFKLNDLLFDKTLINLSELNCGAGKIGTFNDLPLALEKLKDDSMKLNVICLLIITKPDYYKREEFYNALNKLEKLYDNVFIIESKDAHRINVYASPTRMYFDENKKVFDVVRGISKNWEVLYREIRLIYNF